MYMSDLLICEPHVCGAHRGQKMVSFQPSFFFLDRVSLGSLVWPQIGEPPVPAFHHLQALPCLVIQQKTKQQQKQMCGGARL